LFGLKKEQQWMIKSIAKLEEELEILEEEQKQNEN